MSVNYSTCLLVRLLQTHTLVNLRKCSTKVVLTKELGNNAVVVLNRPKSLNAMNVDLQREVHSTLKELQNKKSLVILKGAGDRAFSAGGDLILLKEAGLRGDFVYLNGMGIYLIANIYLINKYKVPIVAFMNGITFGAGAGYAVSSKYRIATEKTKFSMPEAKIAFHPNSSATYFFHHTVGKLGYYLALTGNTISGADVVRAGFATHYCRHSDLPLLEDELLNCSSSNNVEAVLDNFHQKDIPELSLAPVMDNINRCFSEPTVEGIFLKLQEDGSPWAQNTLSLLKKYSPTSLKVILRQMQRGKDMDLLECLKMEYNLTVNFYRYKDTYEGTRIVLEDKNDTPKWDPPNLADVTEDIVEKHFEQNSQEEVMNLIKLVDRG